MSEIKNANSPKNETTRRGTRTDAQGREVEVLYQRMGDRWFAFSLIDDEVFVGSLTPEEILAASEPKSRSPKMAGKA